MLVKWFLSLSNAKSTSGKAEVIPSIGNYHMTGKVKRIEKNKAVSYSWHDKLQGGEMMETAASFKVAKKGGGPR